MIANRLFNLGVKFRSRLHVVMAGTTISLCLVTATPADEAKGTSAEKRTDETAAKKTKVELEIDRSFERYKVYVEGDSKPLNVMSVLTWNNPLAGGTGKYRTVIFLQDGQPKAACCTWGSASNRLYHEFGSLTRKALRGTLDGRTSWKMAGREFRPVPDADAPLKDRRRRLLQMKRLIQRFTAIETMSRQGKPTREQLRMLPTPLYRYEKESGNIVDGAVFCYVHTTDPEALVVLEAVQSGGAMRWEYAFVRRTTLPVIGQLDEKTVWTTDEAGYEAFNQLPYSP